MGKRLSAEQWKFFKENFLDDVKNINPLIIDMDSQIFKRSWSRHTVTTNQQTKVITIIGHDKKVEFCDKLKELLDWCDEHLESSFYAEALVNPTASLAAVLATTESVAFYFFEEEDAVLFKLTWWNI